MKNIHLIATDKPSREPEQQYGNLNYGGGFTEEDIKRISEKRFKQKTLEEAAERYSNDWEEVHPKLNFDAMSGIAVSKIDFIEGAKWQAERIPHIIEEYLKTAFISNQKGYMNPKEWFEQFKKKKL